jgi:uncharacterized protein (DUF362 family)
MHQRVHVNICNNYDVPSILSALPSDVFYQVNPSDSVIIKPNWVMESHKSRPDEWEYVVTHPAVITAVLRKVLDRLSGNGRITIIDGPMTEASFDKLIRHYPVALWQQLATQNGVTLEVIDLREHEWTTKNDIIIERKPLQGDPRGKVVVDLLGENSEFYGHKKSRRGYYGADYDRAETNRAHDGHHNLYSVSKTVIEGDVFINIPKLKTHRKAGITCCLKNLVGINTYKNYLPHHSEGGPSEEGDQFPSDNLNACIEGPLVGFLKQRVFQNTLLANILSPLNTVGKKVFGDSSKVVRNGSWYGNDTAWRMILDLNKVLSYANPDGTMRPETQKHAKRYIGIVDAILAGEAEGPLSPDPVVMGKLICGTNPVSIDAACAILMGFDPLKIPAIANAFGIQHFPLCNFTLEDIGILINTEKYCIDDIPSDYIVHFKPQYGWNGHIEKETLTCGVHEAK